MPEEKTRQAGTRPVSPRPDDPFGLISYLEEERSRLIRLAASGDGPPGRDALGELAAVQTCITAMREDIERDRKLGFKPGTP